MTILKYLLIFYAIYYILKVLLKFFIGKTISNFGNNAENNASFYDGKPKEEGEITIHASPKKEKIIKNDIGEYTDFEDIDK